MSGMEADGTRPGSVEPKSRRSLLGPMSETTPPRGGSARGPYRILDLTGGEREAAVPILRASFVGYYRWHAKRTLREADTVRGAHQGAELRGVAMLDRIAPEVGYVFYLAVAADHRREGVGAALLDDALDRFRGDGAVVVYGVVEPDNRPSLGLFRSRGFREVERRETSYREGGLGAWGLRSKMRIVQDELLLGLRLTAGGPPA